MKSWPERFDEADARGGEFTEDDRRCAGRWQCCAYGQQSQAGRQWRNDHLGEEDTDEEDNLGMSRTHPCFETGMDFYRAVEGNDVPEARRLFAVIGEQLRSLGEHV